MKFPFENEVNGTHLPIQLSSLLFCKMIEGKSRSFFVMTWRYSVRPKTIDIMIIMQLDKNQNCVQHTSFVKNFAALVSVCDSCSTASCTCYNAINYYIRFLGLYGSNIRKILVKVVVSFWCFGFNRSVKTTATSHFFMIPLV